MPFDTRLIAIDRQFGKYSVQSQLDGGIDLHKLDRRGRMSDVTTNRSFRDFAGVFTRDEIMRSGPNEKTSAWLESLPTDAWIMVVEEEWESGMGD